MKEKAGYGMVLGIAFLELQTIWQINFDGC
jgi:hypothetical protein